MDFKTQSIEVITRVSNKIEPLMEKTFKNIIVEGIEFSDKEILFDPTMLVCSHRSHLDYMLLGLFAHKYGLRGLRFAAGDNLTSMPYIGKLFLSWGAFPVHRSKAMNRRYLIDLCTQVQGMLEMGGHIIVFPEGGRSYSGSMLDIKSGILAAAILAQYNNPDKDFLYRPVTISYERLPEICYFDTLLKGKSMLKNKASGIKKILGSSFYFGADIIAFSKFMIANKIGINYGDVFIDFAKPFSVSEIVDVKKLYNDSARNPFSAHREAIKRVETKISDHLYALYRILPVHILAQLIIKKGELNVSVAEKQIEKLIEDANANGRNCKSLINTDIKEIFNTAINQLMHNGGIKIKKNKIIITNRRIVDYYAQTLK